MNQNEHKTLNVTVKLLRERASTIQTTNTPIIIELRRRADALERSTKATVDQLLERADMIEKIVQADDKSKQEAQMKLEKRAKPPTEELGKKINEAIKHYCDEWRKRYKASALITRQQIGQMQSMVKDMPLEKLKVLVTAYLKMNDSWYIKRRHDLSTMRSNLQAVSHYAETGAVITDAKLRQMDNFTNLSDMANKVHNGEL